MIVCHCNRIDHTMIEETASRLAGDDPLRILTPVGVYKAMGLRPRCGGCLTLAANIIHSRNVVPPPHGLSCACCPIGDVVAGLDESDPDEDQQEPMLMGAR